MRHVSGCASEIASPCNCGGAADEVIDIKVVVRARHGPYYAVIVEPDPLGGYHLEDATKIANIIRLAFRATEQRSGDDA